MFVFEKSTSFEFWKGPCWYRSHSIRLKLFTLIYAFPDSVEKFYQFQQGSFKKLEICALTIGNFGVFFQKRTCWNITAPDYGLNENQVLGRLFVVQFIQHFYDNIKIDNRILYHVVLGGGNFFT